MPFQISLHSRTRSRGIINSMTAGPDQFATCASQITLTAVVDGNLGGHNILWEQTSGDTQIVWLTPTNQLVVTFAIVGGGSNDRTFRFYIDKGTPLEQFDDVITWGTPTETDPALPSLLSPYTDTDTACRNIVCSSITLTPAPLTLPNLTSSSPGVITERPTLTYRFTWTAPSCDTQYLQYTTIVQNSGGTLIPLTTVLPGTTLALVSTKEDAYYFYVTYLVNGIETTQFSCRYYNPTAVYPAAVYVDEGSAQSSVNNTISATYYTLNAYSPPQEEYNTSGDVFNSTSALYYVLAAAPVTESDYTGPSSAINTVTVTYFSNNGIGG